MKNQLYQKEEAKQFYEDRYEKGYMDEWPTEKKQRVFEVIKLLNLPESGTALDFGCGNGVFTNVLKQALPNWKVYGSDISVKAIENAKNRFKDCLFFVSDNEKEQDIKFDFLFSHHVLEHVFDIKKTTSEINALLKPQASVLHIFPCGNEGSFEYNICIRRKDGINSAMENRFFFEDEGHIRRLTTLQTNDLMKPHDFALEKDFYSNQHAGAIKWISQSALKFIWELTNTNKAIDKNAFLYLFSLRIKFLFLFLLQAPAIFNNRIKLVRNKKLIHYLFLIVNFIPSLLSSPIYAFYK
jgi:SAM-dependent methyltransferase